VAFKAFMAYNLINQY